MSKLRHCICPKCGRVIERHDAARVSIKVGEGSRRQGVYRYYHLQCCQAGN